jgi:hypothetical protein
VARRTDEVGPHPITEAMDAAKNSRSKRPREALPDLEEHATEPTSLSTPVKSTDAPYRSAATSSVSLWQRPGEAITCPVLANTCPSAQCHRHLPTLLVVPCRA